jgi:broad specificity phosphatase PhoE
MGIGIAMAVTELILTRHGESVGNVARERAEADGAEVIDAGMRDADVPLSPVGRLQAGALGREIASWPAHRRPTQVLCSPYARARETAEIAARTSGATAPMRIDERLRDRELGVLDLLTSLGVERRFPAEAQRRRWLGKFYYRPPGGESWADLVLRLRSALADLDPGADGPVLVVAHDAVILLIRYICEGLDEAAILDIARSQSVANTSITRLARRSGSSWELLQFNDTAHLESGDAPVTEHPAEHDVLPR